MTEKKFIYGIDAAILVGTLISIYFVYFSITAPAVSFSPEGNSGAEASCVLFSFENNGPGTARILVANDLSFYDAKSYIVDDGLEIELESGAYYMRVDGTFDSFPRHLRVEERIILRIFADGNLYKVISGSGTYGVRQINERGETINNYNLIENCRGANE